MCVSFFTRENALRTVHHCRCRQTDFEWHNGPSESPFHFPAKPASVWLHWPMNGGTGTERGTERRKNGWRAGRGNRHLCPGDAQTHTDSHTQMSSVIQPAHGISTLFMNVYICSSQPLLYVCVCVCVCVCACLRVCVWLWSSVGLWESRYRQTHSTHPMWETDYLLVSRRGIPSQQREILAVIQRETFINFTRH